VDAKRGNVEAEIMLSDRQKRFVYHQARITDGQKAYVLAGYSEQGASQGASRLLQNVEIQEAIGEEKAAIARVASLSPEWVLNRLMLIAGADPRELIHARVGCCRNCWGIDHKREWMEHEYATALNDALMSMLLPPAFEGGLGYSPTREPNPDCPMCKGEGLPRTWLADSRKLSRSAAALFAGVKQTKDGIEVKMHSQPEALKSLADYLGMQNKSSADVKLAAAVMVGSAKDLSDDELAGIIDRARLERASASLGVDRGVSSPIALPSKTIEGAYGAVSVPE
jgi:phage terminase small subunit